jgi:hypothetical protein
VAVMAVDGECGDASADARSRSLGVHDGAGKDNGHNGNGEEFDWMVDVLPRNNAKRPRMDGSWDEDSAWKKLLMQSRALVNRVGVVEDIGEVC